MAVGKNTDRGRNHHRHQESSSREESDPQGAPQRQTVDLDRAWIYHRQARHIKASEAGEAVNRDTDHPAGSIRRSLSREHAEHLPSAETIPREACKLGYRSVCLPLKDPREGDGDRCLYVNHRVCESHIWKLRSSSRDERHLPGRGRHNETAHGSDRVRSHSLHEGISHHHSETQHLPCVDPKIIHITDEP